MFDLKAFGKRLKWLRNEKRMTQRQLAEELYISTNHLTKMECGLGAPSLDLMIEMAEYFDVSLDYLILGRSDRVKSKKSVMYEVIEYVTTLA